MRTIPLVAAIVAAFISGSAGVGAAQAPADSMFAARPGPAAPVPGQDARALRPHRPAVVFRGNDGSHCRSFMITEVGVLYEPGSSPVGASSRLIGVVDYGWMKSVGARSAVGATLFGESGSDRNKGGVRLRYRRWLGSRLAFDAAPGVVLVSDSDYRTPGFIAQVGLNAGDLIGVMAEAEVARTIETTTVAWDPQGYGYVQAVHGGTSTAFRVGVKGGSYVGVVATVAAAALVAAVAASFSGSSW
ncbi:MAG: hypothetical protein ACM3PF_05650 [Bacteroidota bacterium]